MKYSGDPEDGKKPSAKKLEEANQFAKRFALRNNLIFGENAHVGNQIPKFVDESGMDVTNMQSKLPSNIITDIRRIPSYVTADNLIKGKDGMTYFEDQTTGDMLPIHPDILRSPRFNPNRGIPIQNQMAAANIFGNRFPSF